MPNVALVRSRSRRGRLYGGVVSFVAAALLGCSTGQIGAAETGPFGSSGARTNPTMGTGGSTTGTGSSGTGGGPGFTPCIEGTSFAPPRLWRLNDRQYANVVHDVFGSAVLVPDEVSEAASVGAEESSTDSLGIADNTKVRNYMSTAEAAAASAVVNLNALMGCAIPDAACVETFIRNKVARAFRRPLTDTEVRDIVALYQVGAADSPAIGVETVLEYVLQSPNFLWRTELGVGSAAAPQSFALGPFEVASALSFLFLDSVPDETLWAKAAAGTLKQPDVESAEVDRLMTLASAKSSIAEFVGSWLAIHKIEATVKDATVFPQFTSAVRDELLQSSEMFLQDVVLGGTLTDLISSSKIYLNAELAGVYGIGGVSGTTLVAVNAGQPQWSGGILTQPSILTANDARPVITDVVHRGLFIHNSMICGASIPGPPPDAAAVNAALPATATERERSNFRMSNAMCRGCHGTFDPFGLLTERYDAIGRYSEYDASHMLIDQSATINSGEPTLDGHADGLPDLVMRLKASPRFSDCAAGKLVSLAVGRIVTAENSCALERVRSQFAKSGSFTDLFRAVATSPAFLTRDANLQ
jgi:hypothetical protein